MLIIKINQLLQEIQNQEAEISSLRNSIIAVRQDRNVKLHELRWEAITKLWRSVIENGSHENIGKYYAIYRCGESEGNSC